MIEAVAFSPNSRWLATGGLDNTVRLWDIMDADPERSCRVLAHGCRVGSMAFSPDGRWLATAAGAWGWQDADRRGRLWDLTANGEPSSQTLPVEPHSVAICPQGRWLVAACRDGTVRLWDLGRSDLLASETVLTGHTGRPHALAFTPDGRWLVSGSHDRTAHLWDLHAEDPGEAPVVFRGHQGIVESVAITPDSHWIVTASNDGTVRLWDRDVESLLESARQLAGREFTQEEKKLYGVRSP